ncbi:MAG: 50S ribosomal protein L31 [Candidatus Chisholmbacteria bacterium RIFCSPHIGHO2_01_FULL_48_12]|uniref:Large ribosomal subunit protein bL31 n=1 Tax=Candidatus Chisholmbacteria bacterium RIFCSPHIGHO2_01_FULL_48_12 TaxID=1797589 RepID=A0A1G1VQQ5_9BACT|nr:MAG: 50S ribosomal protein L31 [Candidatus Chisholmbacteria bacterium RIFCSPHIGHO2_01_FULL_48_12]
MKAKIHPQWYDDAQVTCACGNSFTTGSTVKTIHVDICSACHPLFTGEARYVDTMGRVERFEKMRQSAKSQTGQRKSKKKAADQPQDQPLSLKEMIEREKHQSVANH